jgi:GntR family transcriptional regulator
MNKHSSFLISQTDGRPMYLQIVEQIRTKVALGDWAPGAELPSIRQLAADLCVSVITVKRAYQELERDGVILTQQGRGSIVAPTPKLDQRLWQEELHKHLLDAACLAERLGMTADEAAQQFQDVLRQRGKA